MKILIIESDSSFASTLVHALEARGLDVTTAEDGDKGFELAKAEPPGAIVLSVELGSRRTGGFSLCNKLKRDQNLKGLPLVLMSSSASEETLTQHSKLKTRADHYLHKPFPPEELLRILGIAEEEEEARTGKEGRAAGDIDLGGIEDLDLTGLVGRDFFAGALLGEGDAAKDAGDEWEELIVEPEDGPVALPDDKGNASAAAAAEAKAAVARAAEEARATAEVERAEWRQKEAQWAEERARLEAELAEVRGGQERLQAELAEARGGQERLEAELAEARGGQERLEAELAEAREGRARLEAEKASLEEQLATLRGELEAARRSAAESEEAGAKLQKLEQDLARSQERLLRAYRKLKHDAQVHQQLRGQLVAATELLDSIDSRAATD